MDPTAALSFSSTKTLRVVDPVLLDKELPAEGETFASGDPSFIPSGNTEITTELAKTADVCDWYTALSMCAPTGHYGAK